MTSESELAWYVSYGSNLRRERFLCYIRGGTVPGRTHYNRGCTDTTPPRDDVALEIPNSLYFGGQSPVYEGGVGFITPIPGAKPAKTRAYLITVPQFWEVVSQENHLAHNIQPRPLDVIRAQGSLALAELTETDATLYSRVVHCGEHEGYPLLSFTTNEQLHPVAPSVPYLATIAMGLEESHGLLPSAIADYLMDVPGVHGNYSPHDLIGALAASTDVR